MPVVQSSQGSRVSQVLNKKHSAYSSTTWDNVHLTGGRSGVKLEDGKEVGLKDIFMKGVK